MFNAVSCYILFYVVLSFDLWMSVFFRCIVHEYTHKLCRDLVMFCVVQYKCLLSGKKGDYSHYTENIAKQACRRQITNFCCDDASTNIFTGATVVVEIQ